MFILRYNKNEYGDGSGDWVTKIQEFDTLEELNAEKKKVPRTHQYTGFQILVPYGEQIDYKEKFEELYAHVLKNAGIRPKDDFKEKKEAKVK